MNVLDIFKPKVTRKKEKNRITLDRFLTIKFGSSKHYVKKKMHEKGAVILREAEDGYTLVFNCYNFGGENTEFIIFYFIHNKLSKASVHFYFSHLENELLFLYQRIKESINFKYYTSTKIFDTDQASYPLNDGKMFKAIKNKRSRFNTFWTFKNHRTNAEDYIQLTIDESPAVILTYENTQLQVEYVKERTLNNFQDF